MFVPHLHFCGDCEEAMSVYEKAFNTKPDVVIRDDDGGIIHVEMHIHNLRVMLNNRFGNKEKTSDCAIAAVITFDTVNELIKCYEVLKSYRVLICTRYFQNKYHDTINRYFVELKINSRR